MSGLFLGFWLGRRRVGVVLVTVLLLTLLVVNVGRVRALTPPTFIPNPPVAGEPFTVSGVTAPNVAVDLGSTCNSFVAFLGSSDPTTGAYSFTLTLSAGNYCIDDAVHAAPFTVIPPPPSITTTASHPAYVGAAYLAHKQYCTASPTHC